MSFWWRQKDPAGQRSVYSVGFPWQILILLVALLAAFVSWLWR